MAGESKFGRHTDPALAPPVSIRKKRRTRRFTKAIGCRKNNPTIEVLAERRAQAMELKKRGYSYRQVAKVMHCDVSTAFDYVQTEMIALREQTQEDAREVLEMELARLDEMTKGVWKRASRGEPMAVTAMLRVMERRAKLLGLDAPVKQDITGLFGSLTAERAATMTDEEIKLRIQQLNDRVTRVAIEAPKETDIVIQAEGEGV